MELNKTYLLRFFLLLTTVTLLFFTNGCKKLDVAKPNETVSNSEDKFFDKPSNASPQVQRVMEEFNKRNQGTKLVASFSKKYGQPLWNKGFVVEPKR